MQDFPSAEKIIGELNELEPFINSANPQHPRRGEAEAADWLINFADKFELGNVKRHPIRQSARFEPYFKQERDLCNVSIEAGEGKDELLILHSHFDVVPPNDYGPKDNIAFRQDEARSHIYRGLGGYDMLSGVASILRALHKMKIAKHRRVRAVFVFGEENDSEGTHSTLDTRSNLFEFNGERSLISTEITVGAKTTDPYHLVVGRPGRVGLQATIFGSSMHIGDIDAEDVDGQTCERGSLVKTHLQKLQLQRHPKDVRNILRPGNIRVRKYSSDDKESLSSPGVEHIVFEVHHAHPEEGIMHLLPMVHSEIAKVLGDENFDLKPLDRQLPWTEPWLEELDNPDYPFPHRIQEIAQRVAREKHGQREISFRTGRGVADEGILSKYLNIPIICVPPKGQDPHKNTEELDIRSVSLFQEPIIRDAAGYEKSLIR